MAYNRIAIFGHRGWVSSAIVDALAASGAPITILYRPTSDMSRLPSHVIKVEVNLEDETTVLPGNFAEFALSTLALGVDIPGNRVVFTGDSNQHRLNLCTRQYVAAAYASMFATTPISQLKNRSFRISELAPTGREIDSALHSKHGMAPKITKNSSDLVNAKVEDCLQHEVFLPCLGTVERSGGTGDKLKWLVRIPGMFQTIPKLISRGLSLREG